MHVNFYTLYCLFTSFIYACGQKPLTEFLEIGGVFTLLDILNQDVCKTQDRQETIKVLNIIASSGRRYKELICENTGINSLINGTWFISDQETILAYRTLFLTLSKGNPKEIDRLLVGLSKIVCEAPKNGALLGCYVLRELSKTMEIKQLTDRRIINALFQHLLSADLRLRFEATELLCISLRYSSNTIDQISRKVIAVLTRSKGDSVESAYGRLSLTTSSKLPSEHHISGVARLVSRLIDNNHITANFLIDANIHLLLFDAVIEQIDHATRMNNGETEYMIDTIKELCNVLRKILHYSNNKRIEESIERVIGKNCLEMIKSDEQDFNIEMLLQLQDSLCEQEGDKYIHYNSIEKKA
jgi:hypothetical protein